MGERIATKARSCEEKRRESFSLSQDRLNSAESAFSALAIVSSMVLSPVKDLSGLNICSVVPSSIVKPDRSGRKDDQGRIGM